MEVTFKDGTKVRCTPEHRYLTESGWISAENLEKGSVIQSSLTTSRSILMDLFTESIRVQNICKDLAEDSIDMCGQTPSEIFQITATFITEMETLKTTDWKTLSVSQKKSILAILDQTIKNSLKKLEMLLKNGINLKKGDSGIVDMQKEQRTGQSGKENPDRVWSAETPLSVLFERMVMNKSIVTQIAKPLIIESVKSLGINEDVYCINVPEVHHFSLQNGAIVHNSHFADAYRYLAVSLPKTKDGITKEELNERYRNAMAGPQANLPHFYRSGGVR